MKVLRDNSKNITNKMKENPYPRKIICTECTSELEYEESDMYEGEYGCMYINCPICGEVIILEDNEMNITLTKDNFKFPVHFHHVHKNKKGVKDIFNETELKKQVNEAIEYFRKNKDEYCWGGWITGNLFVYVRRYSEDEIYDIVISENFYNIEIPFEKDDY